MGSMHDVISFADSVFVLCCIACSCHAPKLVNRIANGVVPLFVKPSPGVIETRKKLKTARTELSSLSAIDEFAAHARKKREIQQLEDQLNQLEYQAQSKGTLTRAVLYVACYIALVSIGLINMYRKYGTPFTLVPSEALYPINRFVSFPDVNSDRNGKSIGILFYKCKLAVLSELSVAVLLGLLVSVAVACLVRYFMAAKRPPAGDIPPSAKRLTRAAAAKLAAESEPGFPSTLKDFGYEFRDGKLTDIETGGEFVFEIRKGDKAYNQKRYEALGELITDYVYELLETACNLKKLSIPVDPKSEEPAGFVFASDDVYDCDKLMILTHGAGVVRAGQWARRLIINDGLESGTMLPYILRAKKLGYGILVTNHNQRFIKDEEGVEHKIRGSGDPVEHGVYVWKKIVEKAKATSVMIVAHSMGGAVTVKIAQNCPESFMERVKGIAFTDSVHSTPYMTTSDYWKHVVSVSRNWVTSDKVVDTPLPVYDANSVERVSAGTTVHEETSHFAIDAIFEFFGNLVG